MDKILAPIKQRIIEYIDYKDITKESFYKESGLSASNFKGKGLYSEIGGEALVKILTLYDDLNAEWLIRGAGDMLKKYGNVNESSSKLKIVSESIKQYEEKKNNDILSIPIIEIYAAAGQGYMNTDTIIPTGEINLPKAMFRSSGLRYCVRVKGFSMSPTLQDSDFLIIRHLNPTEWSNMPDEHVYLVVDKDGMAYVKRVKNRFDRGFIVLTSDSIEKSSYPNFNLQADEIANIFYAEWHFSAKMQNVNETYYDRLKSLEDRFDNLENKMKIENNK